MKQKKNFTSWMQLAGLLSAFVFLIILATLLLIFGFSYMFYKMGTPGFIKVERLPIILFFICSLIIGTILAFILGRIPLKPMYAMINAVNQVAKGDFSVHLGNYHLPAYKELADSFNHMVKELSSVEMLRDDFINDFSHEFKTPISSIRGFAKLLKDPDLSEEERNEYLDIIISESERLSELSENTLSLSRLEKQEILRDQKHYNLSEQIRRIICLEDARWPQNQTDFELSGAETYVDANMELMAQVWINLLDNAIKFSSPGSPVKIKIEEHASTVHVKITDQGCGMSEEQLSKIFDKFYQADSSRTIKGNGVGLAIVKRVMDLHKGQINVTSTPGKGSCFEVILPKPAQKAKNLER